MHRQVVSELLGAAPNLIKIEVGDTSNAPYDQGIKGARGTHIEGQAVLRATNALIEELRKLAAARWGTTTDKVSWERGGALFRNNGKTTRLGLKELALLADKPLRGFGEFTGHKPDVYSFQAVVVDVEVDGESGEVKLKHLYFVYDVGTVINPLIHQGQIEGGIVQGLGYALTEELKLDDGHITTVTLGDYKLPNIADSVPLTTSLVQGKPGPGPFGAKCVAEAGISIIAPAVANAIYNATGVRITELPVTAEKVRTGLSCRSKA